MSHFTVMVRIPAATKIEELEDAITAVMAPYQENNMGDCPGEYLEFQDSEDEYLKDYEEGGTEMVKLADGSMVYPFDERFRVEGTFGTGGSTHKVPEGLEQIEVKHKDRFPTFEAFVADWHASEKRDPEKNRFGYWENPNKKWDYWRVISGRLPLKTGGEGAESIADPSTYWEPEGNLQAVRISSIDFDHAAVHTREEAGKFADQYLEMLGGKKFTHPFEGPRSPGLDLGLIDCKDESEITEDERANFVLLKWDRQLVPGKDRFDVMRKVTREEILSLYERIYAKPTSYAYVDAVGGWQQPGRMGWWACTDATPETRVQYADKRREWMRGGDQNDWLAVVDCHI